MVLLLPACVSSPPADPRVDDQARITIESLRNTIAANPDDGARIYVLAQYLDQTGDTTEAMQWLRELERLHWRHGVNDHDFRHSVPLHEYRTIRNRLNAAEPHVVASTKAFTIPQPDLVPEGIAWDAATGDFYVSSIHLRKIVRVSRDGKSADFVRQAEDGIFATLGMKVDAQRRLLWVASNATEEMAGYSPAVDGQSALLAYDLRTGRLATKVTFGSATEPSLLNDLVVLDDGSVLITDSDGGGIMRVRLGSESIEPWIPPRTFLFPNGIARTEGEPFVYVADFNGVSRVDVRSRTVTPVRVPEPETLSGIDGLYWYRGALIGIQNGVGRARVIRMSLDEPRESITSIDVLEEGNPQFDEPTTGAIADGAFFFLANPQLRSFDADHRIWPQSRLHDVIVLRLQLD
ncbi:MAG TPA: SMP-30/gluconolactonase/LRE family protein [Thermoanaerobaculia bacterium]